MRNFPNFLAFYIETLKETIKKNALAYETHTSSRHLCTERTHPTLHTNREKHRAEADLTTNLLPLSSFSHRTSKWVSAYHLPFPKIISDHRRNWWKSL